MAVGAAGLETVAGAAGGVVDSAGTTTTATVAAADTMVAVGTTTVSSMWRRSTVQRHRPRRRPRQGGMWPRLPGRQRPLPGKRRLPS